MQFDVAVAGLDAWFETVRGEGGYGGPVVHWWQQCLMYAGTGLDWRYEGIIAGYLQLWERTGDQRWLAKAVRAGDDLMAGQTENGHYPASAFEANPATAGTPHEAACDLGLLLLAVALRSAGTTEWSRYAAGAGHNLRTFYMAELWDSEAQAIMDSPGQSWFVPNKAATACEALFLFSEITGEDIWASYYAVPTLDRILMHQVRDLGRLDGAIAQNSFGNKRIEKYFPLYIARCVPALLQGYLWTREGKYAESALRAMRFIARWTASDGSLPTVVYANQRVNRYPCWVSPLGDVLRAVDQVRPYGFTADFSETLGRLLAGQDQSGGIQTASGFGRQAGGRLSGSPDVRDVMHVAGWCDKAFRYLASYAGPSLPVVESRPFEMECRFLGRKMYLTETTEALEITKEGRTCYRWLKGTQWPETASPEFWLR